MIMQGPHPFLPNLDDEIVKEMLKRVGASSVSDLFSDIPPEFALGRKLAIPEGKPEATVRREVGRRLSLDVTPPQALCFLGGGVWPHYIPAAVESIVSRQEFYTSYTPYQPEISQGILQALFEYQSLMCDLLGMQACNSSMYDWASGAAEAVRMAARVKNRDVFLVAESIGPQRLAVIKAARDAGLQTSVMFGPLLPFLSDSQAAIDALLEQAADLGVDRIWIDAINPRPRVWPAVAELLRANFPELLLPYRKILFDGTSRTQYLEELRARVDDAARRKSLTDRVAACM